jgi:hypothetical protein
MRMSLGQSVRPKLGEGVHEVTIKEIDLEYNAETFYGPKDLFKICFKSKRGSEIMQKYIAYYDESSSFGKLVHAVLGELPEDFNTKDLIEKPCKITVEPKVSRQGKTFYNVVQVEPTEQPSIEDAAASLFAE